MSGRVLPLGADGPWTGGTVTARATCVLAPNPGPMTLDGTNTWVLAEPGARDGFELVVDRRHTLDRNDLEDDALALGLVHGVAQVALLGALEVEHREVDDRFLAELEGRQADVDVGRQVVGGHLIEHRPA